MQVQVSMAAFAAGFAVLATFANGAGTWYVVRYRMERLEKDSEDRDRNVEALIEQLQKNANETAKLTTAIALSTQRYEDIEDHEDRIRVLERRIDWRDVPKPA